MSRIYAYMRISTEEERGKQKFTRQQAALTRWMKETGNDISDRNIYKDDASGKTFDRKEWTELFDTVQEGDTIVFKSLDRFTRNQEEGYKVYMALMDKGVKLVFIDNPTISTEYIMNMWNIAEKQDSAVTRETLYFIAKITLIAELERAQKEREIISKRTREGIAASPNKSGRKTGQLDKLTPELEKDLRAYMADRTIRGVDVMKKHGISRNTMKKYIAVLEEQDAENK